MVERNDSLNRIREIAQSILTAEMDRTAPYRTAGNVERAHEILSIIRQHESAMPNGKCDCSVRSEIPLPMQKVFTILSGLTVVDRVEDARKHAETAYKLLGECRPYLATREPVSLGEIRNSIEVRSARDVTEVIEVTLRKAGVRYAD